MPGVSDSSIVELTTGSLLGGQVRYAQPKAGFRTGIEPVLLAASIPARTGDRVLEIGTGAGAGLLCLAHRVPGIIGTGVEINPNLAALAAANAHDNGLDTLEFCMADIAEVALPASFDHAFANPPYHPGSGTASPHPARRQAKMADDELFKIWIGAMARAVRPRGSLTLALPAGAIPVAMAALANAGCGSLTLCPLWPRLGQPAKLLLLRALRGGRSPFRVLPGLELHGAYGYTDATEAILRGASSLVL